jgi:hypothetical protein
VELPVGRTLARGLPTPEATRWLLKLHGTVERPESIVLSREDYLHWEEQGSAFGAVVQALLLTRHLLFVGYGLGTRTSIG